MKKFLYPMLAAAVGFGLMAFSYFKYEYDSTPNPWKNSIMYVGLSHSDPNAGEFEYAKRPVRLLPLESRTRSLAPIAKGFGSFVEECYKMSFRQKLILYYSIEEDFADPMLAWGRLPSVGTNEVLAGYCTTQEKSVTVNGCTFEIVGGLKKNLAVFANSYLTAGNTSETASFSVQHDETTRHAYIVQLSEEELANSRIAKQLNEAFPKSQFVPSTPFVRVEKGAFLLYMVGMFLLLFGGSVLFFKSYLLVAGKISLKWLRVPLEEIGKYKYVFMLLHVVYFGLVLLFSLIVYAFPELQFSLLASIRSTLADGSSPLGIAVKAYMSKSILLAAITTFALNFPLGSVASITLPSVIIPGLGFLIACIRAVAWGSLLAPTNVSLAGPMLPHSLTLLLEGEGYILATFFGLLIPIYLFRKAEGPSIISRYGKALLVNCTGLFWVAIVLAIAAVYEAIEVILMLP